MLHHTKTFLFAAVAISLAASGCSSTTDTANATTTTAAPASSVAAASPDALAALVPAPADTQQTKGPDTIPDGGIHMHYQVNGAPSDVMAAYKSALEGNGWAVTTIITSSGSGGGGATYTGTHGDAYGVFDGGGYQNNTYIDVCAWAAKPANPNCTRGDR